MGFTEMLAAAAARGRPLAAILLKNPFPNPYPFQPASAAKTENLFSLAKGERHAPKLCGLEGDCACSFSETQAGALDVLNVARRRHWGALGPQADRWVANWHPARELLSGLPESSRRVARGARVVAPFGSLASQS